MTCALLNKNHLQKDLGLDFLVSSLVSGDCRVFETHNLGQLIESSLNQLEVDDTFNPSVTDAIVDSLIDAEEQFEQGQEPWNALEQMMNLYYQAKSQQHISEIWSERAQALSLEDIRTALWDQFQEALSLVAAGKGHLVTNWLNSHITRFEERSAAYRNIYITKEEITMESELCHNFLVRGADCWLRALKALKVWMEHGVQQSDVEALAEEGQRSLRAVQLFEAEAALAESRYFVNFN